MLHPGVLVEVDALDAGERRVDRRLLVGGEERRLPHEIVVGEGHPLEGTRETRGPGVSIRPRGYLPPRCRPSTTETRAHTGPSSGSPRWRRWWPRWTSGSSTCSAPWTSSGPRPAEWPSSR